MQNGNHQQELQTLLRNFRSDFTFDELANFFDTKCGRTYDREILTQLFASCQKSNTRITANDFAYEFSSMEQNMEFRISKLQREIDDLVGEKNYLIGYIQSSNHNSNQKVRNLTVLINSAIIQSQGHPTIDLRAPLTTSVAIVDENNQILGQTIAAGLTHTPAWNETFSLQLHSHTRKIFLEARLHQPGNESNYKEIGRVELNISDIEQARSINKESNLTVADFRINSKLSFKVDCVQSVEHRAQDEITKSEEKIRQKSDELQSNKVLLSKLTGIFNHNHNVGVPSYNSQHGNMNPYEGGQTSRGRYQNTYQPTTAIAAVSQGNYGGDNQLGRSTVIGGSVYNFHHFAPHNIEYKALERIDELTKDYIKDWATATIVLLTALTSLSILLSFYKPQFFEMTVLLVFMGMCFSGILMQSQHRFLSLLFIASWIQDILWLFFFAKDWYHLTGGEVIVDSSIKTFIIVISIFDTIFIKFPFIVCLWRGYFEFERFKEQIVLKLKQKHLQLNLIDAHPQVQQQFFQQQQQQQLAQQQKYPQANIYQPQTVSYTPQWDGIQQQQQPATNQPNYPKQSHQWQQQFQNSDKYNNNNNNNLEIMQSDAIRGLKQVHLPQSQLLNYEQDTTQSFAHIDIKPKPFVIQSQYFN